MLIFFVVSVIQLFYDVDFM